MSEKHCEVCGEEYCENHVAIKMERRNPSHQQEPSGEEPYPERIGVVYFNDGTREFGPADVPPSELYVRGTLFEALQSQLLKAEAERDDAKYFLGEWELDHAKANAINDALTSQLKASEERAGRLDVAQRILHEIMRSGTGPEGNSIEASLAYEGLAFLAGERTIDDLKRIKALPKDFALDAKRGEV